MKAALLSVIVLARFSVSDAFLLAFKLKPAPQGLREERPQGTGNTLSGGVNTPYIPPGTSRVLPDLRFSETAGESLRGEIEEEEVPVQRTSRRNRNDQPRIIITPADEDEDQGDPNSRERQLRFLNAAKQRKEAREKQEEEVRKIFDEATIDREPLPIDIVSQEITVQNQRGGVCTNFITNGDYRLLDKMMLSEFYNDRRTPKAISLFKTPGCWQNDGYIGTIETRAPTAGEIVTGYQIDLSQYSAVTDFVFSAMPVYTEGGQDSILYFPGSRPRDDIFNVDPGRFDEDDNLFSDGRWSGFNTSFKDPEDQSAESGQKTSQQLQTGGENSGNEQITEANLETPQEEQGGNVINNNEDDDEEERKGPPTSPTRRVPVTYPNPNLAGQPGNILQTPPRQETESRSSEGSRPRFSPPDSDASDTNGGIQTPQRRIFRHVYGNTRGQQESPDEADQPETTTTEAAGTQAQRQQAAAPNFINQARNLALENVQPQNGPNGLRIFPNLGRHLNVLQNPAGGQQAPGGVRNINDLLAYTPFTNAFLGGRRLSFEMIRYIQSHPEVLQEVARRYAPDKAPL